MVVILLQFIKKFLVEKLVVLILSVFLLAACQHLNTTPKEKYNLQFKLPHETDTLFYKVEHKPYKLIHYPMGLQEKITFVYLKIKRILLLGFIKN
jgi:hypothetical protein